MATTTNYSWSTPDDTSLVKDGASAIRTLGSSVDSTLYTALGGAYPGLRLVKKQTIGTGVSSVTVTNAFSATYENYKIVVSNGVCSGTNVTRLTLGASNTQYYEFMAYGSYASPTSVGFAGHSNTSSWEWFGGGTTDYHAFNCELFSPFLSKFTRASNGFYIGSVDTGITSGIHKVATSYTDFTLTSSGTMTGGTIYVYGYGIS